MCLECMPKNTHKKTKQFCGPSIWANIHSNWRGGGVCVGYLKDIDPFRINKILVITSKSSFQCDMFASSTVHVCVCVNVCGGGGGVGTIADFFHPSPCQLLLKLI